VNGTSHETKVEDAELPVPVNGDEKVEDVKPEDVKVEDVKVENMKVEEIK